MLAKSLEMKRLQNGLHFCSNERKASRDVWFVRLTLTVKSRNQSEKTRDKCRKRVAVRIVQI